MVNTYHFDFPSWSEFVDAAARVTTLTDPPGTASQITSADPFGWNGEEWHGEPDFPSALSHAREGWPQGAERISSLTAQIGDTISPRSFRQEIAYSVAGPGTVDLHRYVMGHPESFMVWRDTEDTITANRGFLDIVVNIGALGNVAGDILFTRGAAACALVDSLESQGFRCSVSIVSRVVGFERRSTFDVRCLVKSANEPLETELLAMALANPATLRRLVFALREQAPARFVRDFGIPRSYGRSQEISEGRGDIYLPCANGSSPEWTSPAAAAFWVRQQLSLQGIETENA